uniref:E3 ubiquitin-protein ligase n=1 Tax=Rhabditophanes sp. KR3021 TaxID=114890 RepID=A0AC35TRD9_9BILA
MSNNTLTYKSLQINFKVGNIADQRNADCLVVSTTSKLELKYGAGMAVFSAAGGAAWGELSVARAARDDSPIQIINGGPNLNQKIMLVVVRKHDRYSFSRIYENVFQRATHEHYTHICIPAIGTGAFHISARDGAEMCRMALHNIGHFGSLRQLTFIDINATTINLFENAFRELIEAQTRTPLACLTFLDSPNRREDEVLVPLTASQINEIDEDNCAICIISLKDTDPTNETVKLSNCGHMFHANCITESFFHRQQCPLCNKVYKIGKGPQPPGGTMTISNVQETVPGHSDANGFIQIIYSIPGGIQRTNHLRPGVPFSGVYRTAYLPNNDEGNKVLQLLKIAFERRLIFTVGDSNTNGKRNCLIWNGISHKTKKSGGASRFGYPDHSYLDIVTYQLADLGITENDIV